MPAVSDYRALLSDYAWYDGAPAGRAVSVTYSFATAPPAAMGGTYPAAVGSFQPFDEEDRAAARVALTLYATSSGITLVETTLYEGNIVFSLADLSLMGAANASGLASYPQVNFGSDSRPVDIYIDFAFRNAQRERFQNEGQSDDFVLLPVLKHEIGHALGLKHPYEGEYTLDPAAIDTQTTVMAYGRASWRELGTLDIAAIQALYGAPPTDTFTITNHDANATIIGTTLRDIVHVYGEGATVYTGQNDDTIYTAGQHITVDGGSGFDTVHASLAYRPNEGMTLLGVEQSLYLVRRTGTPERLDDIQTYDAVERVDFTNGTYDFAARMFVFILPAPAAPGFRRWWLDEAGNLVMAGVAPPGLEVVVRPTFSETARTVAAPDGGWSLTLPWTTGWLGLSAVAARDGQDSPRIELGTTSFGGAGNDYLGGPAAGRRFLSGKSGDDWLDGGPEDDVLVGGEGTDRAVIAAARADIRLGIAGDTLVMRGPQGTDTLIGVEQVQFSDGPPVSLATLAASAEPMMATTFGGHGSFLLPDPDSGPLAYLAWQQLGDEMGEIVGGTLGNDFINLLGGDDAMNGLSGDAC